MDTPTSRQVNKLVIDAREIGKEFIAFAKNDAVSSTPGPREDADPKAVYAMLFASAYKSLSSFQLLWRKGFQEDAAKICRSMMEIAFQAHYINLDPIQRSKRFWDFQAMIQFKRVAKLKRSSNAGAAEALTANPQRIQEIEADAEKHLAVYGKDQYWWGNSIFDLVKGTKLEERYNLQYFELSQYAHSTFEGLSESVSIGRGLIVNCGPKVPDRPEIAIEAAEAFLAVVAPASTHMLSKDNDNIIDAKYKSWIQRRDKVLEGIQ
jgi:uncharacterized protein DUF5677